MQAQENRRKLRILFYPLLTHTAVYRQNSPRRILTPGRISEATDAICSKVSDGSRVGAVMLSGTLCARRGWRIAPITGLSAAAPAANRPCCATRGGMR